MTYLQQALAKQRTARLPEEDFTVCDDGHAVTLTVQAAPCEVWTFPWSALVSAWFDQTAKREKIMLTFPRNLIVIRGRNLDRVMVAVGAMRLESVRVRLDGTQAERLTVDKTVVSEIVVSEPEAVLAVEPLA
jgi:hypothetical protein